MVGVRLILAAVLLLSSCGPSVSSGASATAAPSPPYRGPLPAGGFQVGITYDSIRHVTVVLDVTSNPFTVETWTWNGSAWQHLHPSVSPDAVLSLAFDAAHQRVVGFGRNLNASPEIVAPRGDMDLGWRVLASRVATDATARTSTAEPCLRRQARASGHGRRSGQAQRAAHRHLGLGWRELVTTPRYTGTVL